MEKPNTIAAFIRAFHLQSKFFIALGVCVVFFAISFRLPLIFPLAQTLLVALMALTVTDLVLLFGSKGKLVAQRKTGKMLSLGDRNSLSLHVTNEMPLALKLSIYDELPISLQRRDFAIDLQLVKNEKRTLTYTVTPFSRGEYHWGNTNLLATTQIGLVARLFKVHNAEMVPSFPSIIQMKKYELLAFAKTSNFDGIKKVRRLGHSYEFEQIKNYVQGDDIRSINWKATGRRNNLMVNQYEDERSQQMYSIIDKSRAMHMPFNGLSLLDYAVNTSLVISNIALKKHDKAGLITFSDTIGSTIKAERSPVQIKKILNALYNEKAHVKEANYDLLYRSAKNVIQSRSLVFLYTNFESIYAMERALPVLQKINRHHVLVVMIFENTELMNHSRQQVEFLTDIYTQTISDKLILEKKHMVMKLKKYGIQTILSRPEDLSINTVNKYLELKSNGLI
ncbi:MAG: hypothetical protein ACJAU0_000652 [Flavobacteriales bacterium]|jgi:uncharacterized protein (DUF58 family)